MQEIIRGFLVDLMQVVDFLDPVVEFGSLQVEEHQDGDLRSLFAGRSFIGTDMREGPGVDRVEDLRRLSFADGEVGTAICLDTLEHCADPVSACRELQRVVGDGGLCIISSVMLFGIHGYPSDYFRFTPEGFASMLDAFDDVWTAGIGDPGMPMQVVGVGARGRTLDISLAKLPSLAAAQAWWEASAGHVPVGPLRIPPGELIGMLARALPRLARERAAQALSRR